MKKKISILSLMLGILVMPVSCTQDDGPANPADATDGLVPVTLSVNIADGMTTRANNSNGDPEAWRCFVQILDSEGNSVTSNGHIYETMLLDRNTATIFTKYDVYLNPNEDYTFLFWADERELGDADAPYLEDLTAVNYVKNTVAYTGKAEKKGTGDKKPYTVNCELKHIVTKVTLKTTTDLKAGSEIKVKVPKTYATYNVKEQTFTNQTANGYERTVTLTDDITADATNGTEVCSFYALVDNENQPIRITNGNNQGVYKDVTEVPIGPNKHITLRGDVENAGLTGVTFTATVDEDWTDGGTVHFSPYTIDDDGNYTVYNAEGLQAWNTAAQSSKSINCTLAADISMEDEAWIAITDYAGTFDGVGHTISGLKNVNNPNGYGYNKGFIGTLNGGTVRNLVITDASVSGTCTLGGIVGSMENGTVSGCSFSGTVTGSAQNVGGIVGDMSSGTVSGCSFSGTVTGSVQNVGGIVGNATGTVSGCCSYSATINGLWTVGGIVGQPNSAQVISCWSTAEVSASDYVGGISGITSSSTFTACYWSCNVAQGVGGNGSDTTTKVDGNTVTWLTAMEGMNASLSGTNYRWVVNDGTDAATRPLIINRYQ